MSDFLEELKDYFKNTPREQIESDWKKHEKWDEVGITVDDLLKTWEDESKTIKED
mgnify:CR=1 FL=1